MEPLPLEDDEAFLDDALERLVDAWNSGTPLPVQELVAARPDLENRILALAQTARLTAVQNPRPRTAVAGYEIVQQLGRGGMGTVYLARQRRLGRLVALKVLPEHALMSPRARERFRREARVLASLNHPNIITVHDVVEQEGVAAYAMEWIDGPTLAASPPRDPVDACRMAIAVLRALGVVHSAGLVHRDVSARNVLLRADGTPVLTDFGLVSDRSPGFTTTGEFVGTAAYAAPEQLRGDHDAVGPAADQYSVGVLLFEALYGRHPFEGAETAATVLQRMESGVAPQPRRVERTLSRDLEVVIGRALEFDPDRRYESAGGFADDLERVLAFKPILAKPPGLARRLRTWLRRHRKTLFASVTAALVVAAVAVWFLVDQARRARLPAEVAATVRAARTKLLDPEIGARLFFAVAEFPDERPLPDNRLAPALRAYDHAVGLAPDDRDLAIEREVVRLARDLRAGRSALGPEWWSGACPLASRYARSRRPPEGVEDGDAADRRALGLLAYLLGDPKTCIAAWSGLDLADPADPLVDAALGDLFLSTGRPALAHPRLLRAARAFPESGHTVISAADAACQVGDVTVAKRLVGRARRDALANPYEMLQCVEADLLAADGDLEAARAAYGRMPSLTPGGHAKYARILRALSEHEAALRLELDLARRYPQVPTFSSLLRHHATSWWAALPREERISVISDALLQARHHVLVDLLEHAPTRNPDESPDSTTLLETDPTPGPVSGRLRDLHLTREILIMNRKSDLGIPHDARPGVARFLLGMDRAGSGPVARATTRALFRAWAPARVAVLAIIATLGIIPAETQAQSQTTFADGDFSAWTSALTYTVPQGSSTANATFVSLGGNPGSAVEVDLTVPTIQPGQAFVHAQQILINTGITWNPATGGEILALEMMFDETLVSTDLPGNQGHVVRLVVEQGGMLYATRSPTFILTGSQSTWETFTTAPWQNGFSIQGPGGGPADPDFSATGAPLRFGLSFSIGTSTQGNIGSTRNHRYDNWQVVVTHAAPAQPYPGTEEDFVLATGLNGAACTTGSPSTDIKQANGGDVLEVCLSSPGGAFVGAPIALVGQVLPAGTPLTAVFPIPLDRFWLFPFVELINGGTSVGPVGSNHVVGFNGPIYSFVIPAALTGQQVGLQAAAFQAGVAVNGSFALSEAHVIEVN